MALWNGSSARPEENEMGSETGFQPPQRLDPRLSDAPPGPSSLEALVSEVLAEVSIGLFPIVGGDLSPT